MFQTLSAAAEEDKAQLLERLDGSSQASAAILSLERTAAAQAEEIRDLQRVRNEIISSEGITCVSCHSLVQVA